MSPPQNESSKTKKTNKEGDFPNRLIVPTNNFTSAFPELGYLGIRRIFDSTRSNTKHAPYPKHQI